LAYQVPLLLDLQQQLLLLLLPQLPRLPLG
jgi:hypothetical protein